MEQGNVYFLTYARGKRNYCRGSCPRKVSERQVKLAVSLTIGHVLKEDEGRGGKVISTPPFTGI
jgi:hypothetical protein